MRGEKIFKGAESTGKAMRIKGVQKHGNDSE